MDELNKTAATEPKTRPEAAKLQDAPRRRVGSLTLGACLIAAGIFFLCYYFVPGFDWQLVVRIAPAAALVLLGCEEVRFCLGAGLSGAHRSLYVPELSAHGVERDRPCPRTERDEAEQGVHHTGV